MSRDCWAVPEQTLELRGCSSFTAEGLSAALIAISFPSNSLGAASLAYQAVVSGQDILPLTAV